MTNAWRTYQDEAASFFRALGLRAETDATVQGVRTSHDVDILVTAEYAGFRFTWIVECKNWQSRVTKLHVLALREIVADTGVDRGILLAETGFQSGAQEAAALTNVQLTTLAELRASAEGQVYAARLLELYDRVEGSRARYWSIDKHDRIGAGLRPAVGQWGYSGARTLEVADDLLKKAFRGVYPVIPDELHQKLWPEMPRSFNSARELHAHVEFLVQTSRPNCPALRASCTKGLSRPRPPRALLRIFLGPSESGA
jgi:hypothetical protein